MCHNSKRFNLIFTKKYTDHLTIIRNNFIKFHEIWISRSQVTVRHVYAGQTDGRTDGHRTFVYHNTSRQNFDGRIKIAQPQTNCNKRYLGKIRSIGISYWSYKKSTKIDRLIFADFGVKICVFAQKSPKTGNFLYFIIDYILVTYINIYYIIFVILSYKEVKEDKMREYFKTQGYKHEKNNINWCSYSCLT